MQVANAGPESFVLIGDEIGVMCKFRADTAHSLETLNHAAKSLSRTSAHSRWRLRSTCQEGDCTPMQGGRIVIADTPAAAPQ